MMEEKIINYYKQGLSIETITNKMLGYTFTNDCIICVSSKGYLAMRTKVENVIMKYLKEGD